MSSRLWRGAHHSRAARHGRSPAASALAQGLDLRASRTIRAVSASLRTRRARQCAPAHRRPRPPAPRAHPAVPLAQTADPLSLRHLPARRTVGRARRASRGAVALAHSAAARRTAGAQGYSGAKASGSAHAAVQRFQMPGCPDTASMPALSLAPAAAASTSRLPVRPPALRPRRPRGPRRASQATKQALVADQMRTEARSAPHALVFRPCVAREPVVRAAR